jgi:EAL domain-containing protein (putative c-di-GMP-specific phosphodiesterase class I)
MSNADQAMYASKNAGRNRFSYFTRSLQEAALNRMHLINDLRGALSDNQFRLHYQPVVELASRSIHKAEALIRWEHPERGLISPAEFIVLAEESGMIVEIGDWVFREAALQVQHLRTFHHPDFQVSVNKSPVQFRNDERYFKKWLPHLQQMGLPGQCIVIEITEGLLLDASDNVQAKLLDMRDAGIQVALDDFGTGYSSLSYLKKFDIDYLKIDRSFVRNLSHTSDDMALCEAIIVMAHKLGLKVIAEGIETAAQSSLLTAAGCDYGQGHFFSHPLPANEFEALLRTSNYSA